jgi:hypothetical protein
MYHFETIDPKTKKVITFEDKDLKTILMTILNHDNGKPGNDDDTIVFEDAVSAILLTVTEKNLKHILGMEKIRKSAKLDKSIDTYNKLKVSDIATITFNNKSHEGVVTIWQHEVVVNSLKKVSSKSDDESEDEFDSDLENELLDDSDDDTSGDESIHMKTNSDELQKENKLLKEKVKNMEEQIEILKSFVTKYRDMSLKINDDAQKVISNKETKVENKTNTKQTKAKK